MQIFFGLFVHEGLIGFRNSALTFKHMKLQYQHCKKIVVEFNKVYMNPADRCKKTIEYNSKALEACFQDFVTVDFKIAPNTYFPGNIELPYLQKFV